MNMAFYEDFMVSPDGDKIAASPTCIHFKRMSNYNPDWTIERIIFFEYMLVCRRSYGNDFFKQEKIMTKETRLSKYHLRQQKSYFIEQGFISTSEGKYSRTIFHINKEWVYSNLRSIFDFSGLSVGEAAINERNMKDFYVYQLETQSTKDAYGDIEVLI